MLFAIIICLLLSLVISRFLIKSNSAIVALCIMFLSIYLVVITAIAGEIGEVTLISETTYPVIKVQEYITGGGKLNKIRNNTRFYYEVDGEEKQITQEQPIYTITGEETITETVYHTNYSDNKTIDSILHYIFFDKETNTYYTVTK